MTKELFLEILKDGLSDFPEGELSDILYDYKEHFDVGFSSGKSEEDIINELGEPHDIVAQYRNGYFKKYEVEFEEDNNTNSDYNDFYSNVNNQNTDSNKQANNITNRSNSFIITAIIIILSLIFFGPIATGLAASIISLFLALFGVSLGLLVASSGILIGKFVTSTVGIFSFPEFMLHFPDSVLVLIFFGALCLFIFSILSLYYLIKQFIRWIKQLVNWTSTKLRGE